MAEQEKRNVITPVGRVAFPHVFKARAPMGQGEPKFSVTLVFDSDEGLKALRAEARRAVVEKWGADKDKWPKGLKSPFRDGREKDHLDGFEEGQVFISATSKFKPGVVDKDLQPIIDETEFYGGCYGRASVAAFAYDTAGNRGVAFGLRNVQKVKDGTPFGGRTSPEDDFDAIDTGDDDGGEAAPAAGGDDFLD